LCDITEHKVVICCQHFRKIYWPHLQRSRNSKASSIYFFFRQRHA